MGQNSVPVNTESAEIRAAIGSRLREEREKLHLNQTEFAAKVGASKRTQQDWEKGLSTPNAEVLERLAFEGVDITYVVTGHRPGAISGEAGEGFADRHAAFITEFQGLTTMQGLSREEASMLAAYRQLTDPDRAVLERVASAMRLASG